MQKTMSFRFSFAFRVFGICLLLATFASVVSADIIRLKNGQRITGKIVSYGDRKFVIVYENSSPDTRATIALDDIDSVEFDGRPLPGGSGSSLGTPTDGGGRSSGGDTSTVREPERPTPPPVSTTPAPKVDLSTASVVSKDDWTFAQIEVRKGDRVSITADGKVRLSAGLECSPEGVETEDRNKLIPDRPTGSLIAVIGTDNDEFIYVGKSREFTALRSGKLFLSVNEGDLADNSGSFTARVQVERRSN